LFSQRNNKAVALLRQATDTPLSQVFRPALISLQRWSQEGVKIPIYDPELAAIAAWFVVIE
jgi:hypothetical protein